MFDQQQQKLLSHNLSKVRRQYNKHKSVYEVSGFDQHFDKQLRKLVIHYAFDFEAIAFHLYFLFPQYSHRLKPQAVSYRWYQLTLQSQGENIRKQLQQLQILTMNHQKVQKQYNCPSIKNEQNYVQDLFQYNLQEKKIQYDLALKMATVLDDEEENGFMLYKPKFIVDSQFKLQRKRTQDTQIIEQLINKQYRSQYGSFQPPQAAPMSQCFQSIEHKFTAPEIKVIGQQSQKEENYFDEDWQAYESD